jgi:hypothetical protein
MNTSSEIATNFCTLCESIYLLLILNKSVTFEELNDNIVTYKTYNPTTILLTRSTAILIQLIKYKTENDKICLENILNFLPDVYDTSCNQVKFSSKYPNFLRKDIAYFYVTVLYSINHALIKNGYVFIDELFKKICEDMYIHNPYSYKIVCNKARYCDFLESLPPCYTLIGCIIVFTKKPFIWTPKSI